MISEKAKACPKCGCPIEEISGAEENKKDSSKSNKRKCAECGKVFDKGLAECPNCGCPIEQPDKEMQTEADSSKVNAYEIDEEQKKRKKKNVFRTRRLLVFTLIIALLGIFVVVTEKIFREYVNCRYGFGELVLSGETWYDYAFFPCVITPAIIGVVLTLISFCIFFFLMKDGKSKWAWIGSISMVFFSVLTIILSIVMLGGRHDEADWDFIRRFTNIEYNTKNLGNTIWRTKYKSGREGKETNPINDVVITFSKDGKTAKLKLNGTESKYEEPKFSKGKSLPAEDGSRFSYTCLEFSNGALVLPEEAWYDAKFVPYKMSTSFSGYHFGGSLFGPDAAYSAAKAALSLRTSTEKEFDNSKQENIQEFRKDRNGNEYEVGSFYICGY